MFAMVMGLNFLNIFSTILLKKKNDNFLHPNNSINYFDWPHSCFVDIKMIVYQNATEFTKRFCLKKRTNKHISSNGQKTIIFMRLFNDSDID